MTSSKWLPDKPFNDLPPIPPSADLHSKKVLQTCISARVALAELKRAANSLPNPGMLINTLPILEAQASSEIENIVTTTDRLFQLRLFEERADTATKEALRYSVALMEGFKTLDSRPLNTRTAEAICSRIKGVEMRVRRVPGTVLQNDRTGEIIYTPPEGEDIIRRQLSNWEKFIHESIEIDPLIRMAVAHYQFEAIHPFTDGNGRTGRVINSLFLISENLLSLPVLYLSRFIIQNKSDYYALLLDVTRKQAWEPWILYMLNAVESTSHWTTAKIDAINELSKHTVEFVKKSRPKIYTRELVEVLFRLPYCRIQDVAEVTETERHTAARYLRELVKIGMLEEQTFGRDKLFIHSKLLRLLTRDSNNFSMYS